MWDRPNCAVREADESRMHTLFTTVSGPSMHRCVLAMTVASLSSLSLAGQVANAPNASSQKSMDVAALRNQAEAGDSEAMFKLGLMHARGRGVKENDAEAMRWYERAAEAGHAAAMTNLAGHHARGEGTPISERRAVEWLERAAKTGSARAKCALAARMLHGAGVAKDEVRSHQFALEAAAAGDAAAMLLVARGFTLGRGVERNETLAAQWTHRAAKSGDARAMGAYGAMLAEGRGVSQNAKEAFYWHRAGALAGDRTAMANLALAYLDGEGVSLNLEEGQRWLRAGAEAGDALAMVALGDVYAGRVPEWCDRDTKRTHETTATGIAPFVMDHASAVEWYTRAAEMGHSGALTSLAVHHADGLGVEIDEAKAVSLLRVAADAGVAEAMLNLSGLLAEGRGTQASTEEAYYWALNGSRLLQGDLRRGAQRYAATVGDMLSPTERDLVIARSDRFVDTHELRLAQASDAMVDRTKSRRVQLHRTVQAVADAMRETPVNTQFATGSPSEP